jgi:DNA primase
LAPGSRKDLGYLHVKNDKSTKILICESAIDAISYYALDPHCMALSTAGAHPNPAWLSSLINKESDLFCAFDADKTGDALAQKMIALYPTIKRLRPINHDWNDVLKSSLIKPPPQFSS